MSSGWDLIVVGAGSAGAVVAARSAVRGKRVLLLEAGPDYPSAETAEIWRSPNPLRALLDPAAGRQLIQPGLVTRRSDKQGLAPYIQGRGAGGGSSINGQIAIRPPVEDFTDWVEAGCVGWGFDDVLPHFVASETDADFPDAHYHGGSGPLPVHRNWYDRWGAVDRALHDVALSGGFPWAPDVNAPGATGISAYPSSSRDHRRVSTNDAYLDPMRHVPELCIRGDSQVDRILFRANRAIGVRVLVDGGYSNEYADRVVLSAGAIHSPAILLRSGLGPASELRDVGIEVRGDLPVGRGLQDHSVAFLGMPLDQDSAAGVDDRYTNTCVRFSSGQYDAGPNDIMFVACNQNVLSIEQADPGYGAGALIAWINRPFSSGSVRIASPDPTEQPVLEHRLLSDERDLVRMRSAIRLLATLAREPRVQSITNGAFEQVNAELLDVLDSDPELDDYLLGHVADGQHASSTCRMGDPNDGRTVLGPDCSVHGTERLHVVDASIFPSCPRANPNLATIMAGELMASRL